MLGICKCQYTNFLLGCFIFFENMANQSVYFIQRILAGIFGVGYSVSFFAKKYILHIFK